MTIAGKRIVLKRCELISRHAVCGKHGDREELEMKGPQSLLASGTVCSMHGERSRRVGVLLAAGLLALVVATPGTSRP